MSDPIEITTEQKLKLAQKALSEVLKRIKIGKVDGYNFGPGSTTFEFVTAAFSALSGLPLKEVQENIFVGSSAISSSMEDVLETLR